MRLVGIAQAELRGRLDAIPPRDFVEIHRNVETLRGGARLQFVTLRQTVGGVPIDDSYLQIGVRYPAHTVTLDKEKTLPTFFIPVPFVPRIIPLIELAGKKITVRFHFDTVDPFGSGEGWFIDRLRVVDAKQ